MAHIIMAVQKQPRNCTSCQNLINVHNTLLWLCKTAQEQNKLSKFNHCTELIVMAVLNIPGTAQVVKNLINVHNTLLCTEHIVMSKSKHIIMAVQNSPGTTQAVKI